MKKKILVLICAAMSMVSYAQIVNVITGQFVGTADTFVSGDNIFLTSADNSIFRIDLSQSNPSVEESFPFDAPLALFIEGSQAYISNDSGEIYSVDASDFSTNLTNLGSVTGRVFDLLVVGDFLYLAEFSNDRISRIDLNNPGVVEGVIDVNEPQGLALIGDELYFSISGDNAIGRINITDATPTIEVVVSSGLNNPGALINSENILLIAEPEIELIGGRILTLDTSLPDPIPTVIATGLAIPLGLATFQNDVYFIQTEIGNLTRVNDALLSVPEFDNAILNSVVISPNPIGNGNSLQFSNLEHLSLNDISIYDVTGRVVSQTTFDNSEIRPSTTVQIDVVPGTYIAVISSEEGSVSRKVIIR